MECLRCAVHAPGSLLFATLVYCFLQLICCQGSSSGSSSAVTLDRNPSSTLPILVAPTNLTDSLKLNGTYSLYAAGAASLVPNKSVDVTLAANSSLLFYSYTRVSCMTLQLASSDNTVYAFVTRATVSEMTGSSNELDYFLRRDPLSLSSEVYAASSIASNGTVAKRLAVSSNVTAASGAVSVDTIFSDVLSIVAVNPTAAPQAVKLEVSMSPIGPCKNCSLDRSPSGFLGNCETDLSNTSVVISGDRYNATVLKDLLQPGQLEPRDIDQGTSALLAVFTNAACMLYTVKDAYITSDFNLNKALLSAFVVSSAEQQNIAASGNVTDAQRSTLSCSYPATTDPRRPCFVYTQALNPAETYYVWVENVNGGTMSYQGNVSVIFELMIQADTANCSQGRLFNLSRSFTYLNAPATPLPYTLGDDDLQRSPYDPGVTPFSFAAAYGNYDSMYPIMAVGSDGSLSQAGVWNISLVGASNSYQSLASVSLADATSFSVDVNQAKAQYVAGGGFQNAACFSENLNASSQITSYLIPRSTFEASFNYSYGLPPNTGLSTKAFDSSVLLSRHFREQSVNSTTYDLLPNVTYSFVVERPVRNGTTVSTRNVAFPLASPSCQAPSGLPPAPAAVAATPSGGSGAVRGVFDKAIRQTNGDGSADSAGGITGAACIAFVLSARGLWVNGTGPPLSSQYYNISSPGNSTDPNLSASAILLQGNDTNQQFVQNGFLSSTVTNDSSAPSLLVTPLPVVTGCLVNASSPGPCMAFADGLNASEIYYLWGLIGAGSPSSWLLISFEARPSGSCSKAYVLPVPQGGAALAKAASAGKASIGRIVGPVVAGVVVLAIAVLLIMWLRRRRQAEPKMRPDSLKSSAAVSNVGLMVQESPWDQASPWEKTENQYAYFNDLMTPDSGGAAAPLPAKLSDSESRSAVAIDSKSLVSEPRSLAASERSGTSFDPAEVVANIAAAADSQPRPGARLQASTAQTSKRGPGTLVLEYGDHWEINLSELKLKTVEGRAVKLGEGGFGSVYLGVLGVREVAVKIATGNSAEQKEKFLHEILVLKGCRDPSIVQFLGASVGEEIVLVMEFMPGGDLYRAISKDLFGRFLWKNGGSKLALDIIKGLYHLHSRSIVHMDLKTPNILLSENHDRAKISDVGLAKITTEAGTTATSGISFPWASPEQLLSGKCTAASDMFAFGVILWEICTGDAPKRSRDYRDLSVPEECPLAVADLISQCLEADPALRPTARQAHEVLHQCTRLPSREVT